MIDVHSGAVAIIDDDLAVRDSLKFLLEVTDHKVIIYASAAEFLANRTAQLTCVIIDQHMPKMTGLELASRMRAEGIRIPVLLMTGALSPEIIARAAEIGIEKVLDKPPIEDDLLDFVDAYG
jgi:two-component system response regulator FixJ